MDSDERELGTKLITAKDLVTAIGPYHTAMARLGSSIISLAIALRVNPDPAVKEQADQAWDRLNEFIDQMDKAAEVLDKLMRDPGADRE